MIRGITLEGLVDKPKSNTRANRPQKPTPQKCLCETISTVQRSHIRKTSVKRNKHESRHKRDKFLLMLANINSNHEKQAQIFQGCNLQNITNTKIREKVKVVSFQ